MIGNPINSCSKVGRHCIINTNACVDHDNCISDFVHVAPGAILAGGVNIEARTWIGAGAVIKDHINICSDCMIGAGATVIKDIMDSGVYAGIPARRLLNSHHHF